MVVCFRPALAKGPQEAGAPRLASRPREGAGKRPGPGAQHHQHTHSPFALVRLSTPHPTPPATGRHAGISNLPSRTTLDSFRSLSLGPSSSSEQQASRHVHPRPTLHRPGTSSPTQLSDLLGQELGERRRSLAKATCVSGEKWTLALSPRVRPSHRAGLLLPSRLSLFTTLTTHTVPPPRLA